MNKTSEITSTGIDLIADFPKPIRIENNGRIHNLQAVKNWSEGKNAANIIRTAYMVP
ncbi:hypothetical protein [Methylomonas sp. AM2-LC]|uniref:hypothetical protein n=1 Tax=Methylomonas sp. AM2-LC TaxID=3153301 RepID=UPI0032665390